MKIRGRVRMTYLLTSKDTEHSGLLHGIMEIATKQDQDVFLVSKEGHRVFTHKFILGLYSPLWRDLVSELSSDAVIGVSIPVSFGSLLNLVKILTHGEVDSAKHDSTKEVNIAASLIGIEMKHLNLVSLYPDKEDRCENFSFDRSENGEIEKESPNKNIKQEIGDNNEDCVTDDAENVMKRKRGPRRNLNLKCEDCEKVFSEKGNFNRHALTHSGIKKFQCQDCEMRFSRNDKLKLHVTLVHSNSGAESHICDQCNKTFTRKDHLSRHNTRVHGLQ
jgi:uncharacterized C2H2 Zn-finger protein